MSSSSFTPKDIKAVKAKYTNTPLFKLEPSKTRMNQNKKQPTYYIPFSMKNVAGKYMPLNLKFSRQITASSAKIPFGVEEDQAKDLRVAYRRLDESDLDKTDYQEENQREILLKANEEFTDALNIIADEYYSLLEREVFKYKGDKFKLTKKQRDTIYCFRQSKRKASDGEEGEGDENGMIPLPIPIFRVKLEADVESKKIGRKTEKGHRYMVFDIKKTAKLDAENKKKNSKAPPPKPVIARITVQGKVTDLTIHNARHFITYMSLTGGTIYFDSICISNQGVSILCKFTDLHVSRHRVLKQDGLSAEEIAENVGFGSNNPDEDLDVVVDEPDENGENGENDESKSSKSKSSNSKNKNNKSKSSKALDKALDNDEDGEQNLDDDPVENDGGEEESEQQVDDPDELPKDSKNTKNNKNVKNSDKDSNASDETKKNKKPTKKVVEEPAPKSTKKPKSKETKVESNKNDNNDADAEAGNEPEAEPEAEPEDEPEPEAEPAEDNEDNEDNEEPADEDEPEAADESKVESNDETEAADEDDNAEPAEEETKPEPKKEKKSNAIKPTAKGATLKAGARKK